MTTESGAITPELGLFVIWSNARVEQERILRHTQKLFDVRRVYEIHWTRELLSENYVRFCGGKLDPPLTTFFQEHRGEGPSLLVTAVDGSPRYELRTTPKGPMKVNVRFFD